MSTGPGAWQDREVNAAPEAGATAPTDGHALTVSVWKGKEQVMRFNVMYVNTECYQFSVEAEDKASAREIAENMDIGDHMLEPDWRLQITEGDAPFPNQNEDGEAVPPIYDTEGRLTAISLNCDTLLNKNVQPSRQEQRNLIEGIKHMVQELVESQWKGEPRRG